MNGFRRGGGWGRGAGGYGWAAPQGGQGLTTPTGYRYVGSCRCGLGPNAYYQDSEGRVVPAAALFSGVAAQPVTEVERLRAEKEDLERRLRDLEERLRQKS